MNTGRIIYAENKMKLFEKRLQRGTLGTNWVKKRQGEGKNYKMSRFNKYDYTNTRKDGCGITVQTKL
jgi:hypothetical protein